MTTLQELYGLCGCGVRYQATQDDLDTLGLLLDRLEEVEIFLDSDCSAQDRKDAEVEFNSLTDRIDALVEKV
jgi:hypothetical protein